MRPSVVFSAISTFTVRFKYLPECSTSSPPSPSEKSCVLSGTNSQDKKGLNESRTAARVIDSIYAAISSFLLHVSLTRVFFRDEYRLVFLAWLDVAEMSSFSND